MFTLQEGGNSSTFTSLVNLPSVAILINSNFTLLSRGKPGWMVVNVALANRGIIVEAVRQCAKDRKEWRAVVHM